MDKKEKASLILRELNAVKTDIGKLRELASSPFGYIRNDLRHKVWPKLLGLHSTTKAPAYGESLARVCVELSFEGLQL